MTRPDPTLVRTLLTAALLVPPATAVEAQVADDLPVREVTLANGMRFLILPREGAPTVSFVVQYAVGGVHERPGETGIAHLLEHLLFKGTTTVGTRDPEGERVMLAAIDAVADSLESSRGSPADSSLATELAVRLRALEDSARAVVVPNELDRMLRRAGARNLNATTTHEATTYFVELPANRVELWFVLEADRMRDPVFREFYAERDVVMEERRLRVETSPAGLLYEAHLGAAFTVHPYGQPVVGTMADLEGLTRPEVEAYYRRYYGPRNAVVAIVGSLDPDQVAAWAEAYFGDLPTGEAPAAVARVEPAQEGERRVSVQYEAEPIVRIGWHVPQMEHPDAPALAMLSSLLTGGRTSRLYDALVLRDRLATYVGASLGPGERFPRLLGIDAVPRAPHTTAELEAAIEAVLLDLATTSPTEADLQRVRNQVAAGRVRRLAGNLGLALQLAGSATFQEDWRTTFDWASRIEAVTPEDVQRVAAAYLTRSNRTVATLVRPPGGAP